MADFVNVDEPVGMRWGKLNVKNKAEDQARVIQLLGKIPRAQGGKQEEWANKSFNLYPGICDKELKAAIWEFQRFWKDRGVFRHIDNVVDRDGNTIKKMNSLIRSVGPVIVGLQKVDVIVRFAGVLADSTNDLTENEVFPTSQLFHYQQKKNRRLIRIGQTTKTIAEASAALIAEYVNKISASIKRGPGPFIAEEPGAIFIYGASSGGRNAIDLAAALTKAGFPIRMVAAMDAAFFPNSPELTNSPDNLTGEPTVIPIFNVAPITAQEKYNFYQTHGNHSEVSFHGRLFSSKMAGKEIHGKINGFTDQNYNDEIRGRLPVGTTQEVFDNTAHVALSKHATPEVQRRIKFALDALP